LRARPARSERHITNAIGRSWHDQPLLDRASTSIASYSEAANPSRQLIKLKRQGQQMITANTYIIMLDLSLFSWNAGFLAGQAVVFGLILPGSLNTFRVNEPGYESFPKTKK
jgi:hypothetical protein